MNITRKDQRGGGILLAALAIGWGGLSLALLGFSPRGESRKTQRKPTTHCVRSPSFSLIFLPEQALDKAHQKSPPSFAWRAFSCCAEGVGFEPTVRVNVRWFSRPVHSTRLCHPSCLIQTHLGLFQAFQSQSQFRCPAILLQRGHLHPCINRRY